NSIKLMLQSEDFLYKVKFKEIPKNINFQSTQTKGYKFVYYAFPNCDSILKITSKFVSRFDVIINSTQRKYSFEKGKDSFYKLLDRYSKIIKNIHEKDSQYYLKNSTSENFFCLTITNIFFKDLYSYYRFREMVMKFLKQKSGSFLLTFKDDNFDIKLILNGLDINYDYEEEVSLKRNIFFTCNQDRNYLLKVNFDVIEGNINEDTDEIVFN
ncbi:16126_t:CDS:1, partial [Dentiscutata heterogama]